MHWDNPETKALVDALLELRNSGEAKKFLRDLLTESEIAEFSMRWKVARMLAEGIPYTQIEAETGLSSTTIARVSKWINHGTGGYRMMLRRKGYS